jgi:hypothetical protein
VQPFDWVRAAPRRAGLLAAGLAALVVGLLWFATRASEPAAVPYLGTDPARASAALEDRPDGIPAIRAAAPCEGGGPFNRPVDPAAAAQAETRADEAFAAAGRQLAARQSPAEHALGLYVLMMGARKQADELAEAAPPGCARDEACRAQVGRATLEMSRLYRDRIATIAAASTDSDVYALGYFACSTPVRRAEEGQCAQISAAQWTRLEPDNALPWLYVAGEAAARGDVAGQAEAYFRASRARLDDSKWTVFAPLLDTRLLPEPSQDLRDVLGVSAIGMAVANPLPNYQGLKFFCSQAALADPNRRQVCDDLADMLTARSDTLLGLMIGRTLGERLGWSPDHLNVLRDRIDANMQIEQDTAGIDTESCEARQSLRQWVTDALRYGELGAGQRAIEAGGRTTVQLAQQMRATRRKILDERRSPGYPPAAPPDPPNNR